MNVTVIGGTGHIGSFLCPFLVSDGHDVTVVSRGETMQHKTGPWSKVQFKRMEYARDSDQWQQFIANLDAEVVIDINGNDAPATYHASKQTCQHFIACGSVWMFGPPQSAPTPETTQGPCEFSGYAQRYSELLAIQKSAADDGRAFTAIMPPNIAGPGKIPLDLLGGRSLDLHKAHQAGKPVPLPQGCNTLIGPCDAEDIARAFALAVDNRTQAAGHFFNVGAAYALPAPQLVDAFAKIYKTRIPIDYVPHDTYYHEINPSAGANYHFREHMLPDISKIRARLGYEPHYTPEQTLERAVDWMRKTSPGSWKST